MADVAVHTNVHATAIDAAGQCFVAVSDTVQYIFCVLPDNNPYYIKSTNGGASWGSPVLIESSSGTVCISVWYDRWTPGNSGTLVHIVYMEAAGIFYDSLDTNGDTLSGEISIVTANTTLHKSLSITRTRGGNLLMCMCSSGGGGQTYKSTTVGASASFSSIAAIHETTGADNVRLLPANLADANDAWAIFWDVSSDQLSLKTYDDSLNTISNETAIASTMVEAAIEGGGNTGFAASIRHSDGHIIMAAWSEQDLATAGTADLRVWDIANNGSIVEKTAVFTNVFDVYNAAIYINNINDDIYLFYLGNGVTPENYTATVSVFYKKSSDGGTTWGAQTAYSEGAADDYRSIFCDLGNQAGNNGLVGAMWWDDDDNDIWFNAVNSIAISATTPVSNTLAIRLENQTALRDTNLISLEAIRQVKYPIVATVEAPPTFNMVSSGWSTMASGVLGFAGPFQLIPDKRYILFITNRRHEDANSPAVEGLVDTDLTWSLIVGEGGPGDTNPSHRISAYTTVANSAHNAELLQLTFNAQQERYAWVVLELDSGAVIQSVGATESGDPTTLDALTLAAFADARNGTIQAWLYGFGDRTIAPESGYYEYADVDAGIISLMVAARQSNDTSPQATFTGMGENALGLALEIGYSSIPSSGELLKLESLTGLEYAPAINIESLEVAATPISANQVISIESLQALRDTTLAYLESVTGIRKAPVTSLENLQGLTLLKQSNLENLNALRDTNIVTLENLQALRDLTTTLIESTTDTRITKQAYLESLQALRDDESVDIESLTALRKSQEVDLESVTGLRTLVATLLESLQTLRVTSGIDIENLQAIRLGTSEGAQLNSNSTLDVNINGYTGRQGGSVAHETTSPINGTGSLRVTTADFVQHSGGNTPITPNGSAAPGQTWKVTAKIQAPVGALYRLLLTERNAAGSNLGESATNATGNGSVQEVSVQRTLIGATVVAISATIGVYNGIQPSFVMIADDIEFRQQLTGATFQIESTTNLRKTSTNYLEWLQEVRDLTEIPIEFISLANLIVTSVISIESLQALQIAKAIDIEAQTEIANTLSADLESLQNIISSKVSYLESLQNLTALQQERIEWLQALISSTNINIESETPVGIATSIIELNIESLQALKITFNATLEALNGVAKSTNVNYENTAAVVILKPVSFESLVNVVVLRTADVESLTALLREIPIPWESLGEPVIPDVIVIIEDDTINISDSADGVIIVIDSPTSQIVLGESSEILIVRDNDSVRVVGP